MTSNLKPLSSSSAPPLGKFLASSEKTVRDKAVEALSGFLSARKSATNEEDEQVLQVGELDWDADFKLDSRLSQLELAKLWQGIFYCFWMSDKPLVQQALASHLASLLLDTRPKQSKKNPGRNGRVGRVKSALAFLKGFWDTVVREWSGLDRLRLDKFYLLLRRFIGASFQLLAREEWDLDAIKAYNEVLTGPGGPLNVLDSKIPHSIAYHICDIYIEELERSLPALSAEAGTPIPCVPLAALLSPFVVTLALAPSKTLFERIVDNIYKPLVDELVEVGGADQPSKSKKRRTVVAAAPADLEYPRIAAHSLVVLDEDDDAIEGSEATKLARHVLLTIFKEGGKSTTNEVNRRRMYALYRSFGTE